MRRIVIEFNQEGEAMHLSVDWLGADSPTEHENRWAELVKMPIANLLRDVFKSYSTATGEGQTAREAMDRFAIERDILEAGGK